jgi:integrase
MTGKIVKISGKYVARLELAPVGGKRKQLKVRLRYDDGKTFVRSKKDAEIAMAHLITKIQAENGQYARPGKMTYREFIDGTRDKSGAEVRDKDGNVIEGDWLRYARRRASPKTLEWWRGIQRLALVPAFGDMRLVDINMRAIDRAYDHWLAAGSKLGRPLAPQTAHHYRAVLHHALAEAVRLKLIPRNPVDDVAPRKIASREAAVLGDDGVHKLLGAFNGHALETLVHLAVHSGCRRGELAALRWSSVDFDRSLIIVRESLEETTEHGLRFKRPKNNKARNVALSASMMEMLRSSKRRQSEKRLLLGPITGRTLTLYSVPQTASRCSRTASPKSFVRWLNPSGSGSPCTA